MSDALRNAATTVLDLCRARGWKVATAESCTGGLVAGALTEIAGSSDVVDRGFVTYSNEAKQQMLGVPAATLSIHGAVSRQTAEAMARGEADPPIMTRLRCGSLSPFFSRWSSSISQTVGTPALNVTLYVSINS